MKRLQLVELEDLSWFPPLLRNYMTDFLRTIEEKTDLFGPAVDTIAGLLESNGQSAVVDLASGGGGQWRTLFPRLATRVANARLTLTDYYPNHDSLKRIAAIDQQAVAVESDSVDARQVPDHLHGVRTMFLSLHHFNPEDATKILADAVSAKAPIAVFEAQLRDFKHLIQFAISPLAVLALTPFIRPFSLGRLFFTYLAPVVPLCVGFDGVASVFRTYMPDELLEMAAVADPGGSYEWSAKVVSHGLHKVQIFTGQPRV
ncbi:MAG: hypothetical protein AAF456_07070 [Planctomycetota bacterium]